MLSTCDIDTWLRVPALRALQETLHLQTVSWILPLGSAHPSGFLCMHAANAAAVQARLVDAVASVERLSVLTRSSEQRADDAERRLAGMEAQLESAAAAGEAAQDAQQRAGELQEALDAASAQVEDLKVLSVPKSARSNLYISQHVGSMLGSMLVSGYGVNNGE